MARFALEPGETEIHHELATWIDGDTSRSGALIVTERRVAIVTRPDAHGFFQKLRTHFSADRHILEVRRDEFVEADIDEEVLPGLKSRTRLTLRTHTGPAITVVVTSAADVWRRRIERWSSGQDLPTIPLPRADLRK